MAKGCFTSHALVPGVLCVKIDDSISFEQGAALPCVYTTTLLALVDKANLQKGQVSIISLISVFKTWANSDIVGAYTIRMRRCRISCRSHCSDDRRRCKPRLPKVSFSGHSQWLRYTAQWALRKKSGTLKPTMAWTAHAFSTRETHRFSPPSCTQPTIVV